MTTDLTAPLNTQKSQLVPPHGSPVLKEKLLTGDALTQAQQKAKILPQIQITSREAGDLIMLGIGGFTPLDGFMNKADWQSVCDNMHLSTGENAGVFFPIPITLSTDSKTADTLQIGDEVALVLENDIMGILTLSEKYRIDKAHECQTVFGTTDSEHPGVAMVIAQGDVNLAGDVVVLSEGVFP